MTGIRETLIEVALDPVGAASLLDGLSGPELDRVLETGSAQGLGTALAVALHTARVPVPTWLEAHRFDRATRRAQIGRALAAVAPALTAAGVPWVVLKGPVVAASYRSPMLREYVDLDLLVPGGSIADVLEALAGAGMSAINRNWEAYLAHGVAEFPLYVAGTPVDLHWHLIGLERDRRRFAIVTGALLERRRLVTVDGVAAGRLDDEDHLIHVALHAGLSGAGALGLLRDVHETVLAGGLDWDVLVSRAADWGAAPVVGQVLDRCQLTLDTPVPGEVPGRLVGAVGLAIRRRLDAWSRGRGSEHSFPGFPVATARRGLVGTAIAARGGLWARARRRLGRPSRWSAYDPEGPLYWDTPSADPAAFAAYAAYAARSA